MNKIIIRTILIHKRAKKVVEEKLLFMGKQELNFELNTNLKLCTIPRVMYCGAIARVICLRVCAIVHN